MLFMVLLSKTSTFHVSNTSVFKKVIRFYLGQTVFSYLRILNTLNTSKTGAALGCLGWLGWQQ